jgi:hypothetical protein
MTFHLADEIALFASQKKLNMTHEIALHQACLFDIAETIKTSKVELGQECLIEPVECKGIYILLQPRLTLGACRLSAILSTFPTIQAVCHLADSVKQSDLSAYVYALFRQIAHVDNYLTWVDSRELYQRMSDLEKAFLNHVAKDSTKLDDTP